MILVYQFLDILSTIVECFCLYAISRCLCKQPRFHSTIGKCIPPIAMAMFIWGLTWLSQLGAVKIPLIFIFSVIILKISYKDSVYQSLTVAEVWLITALILTETICYGVGYWLYGRNLLDVVDGQTFTRWELYAVALLARFFVLGLIYLLLKDFKYKIQLKDSLVLTFVFLVSFAIAFLSSFNVLNLSSVPDLTLYMSSGILSAIFIMFFMYSKNTMYLREQEQRDKIQIAQLQQQYDYYQDKLKEEERIRSIYHDMKNHLLVLEGSQETDATRQMAQELRSQFASYENYIHTGNSFLDIIIRDKAEKAREKHIDFSANIDFNGMDFIEPLDISTFFGNGIDNAIEASEKLPEEQRVILVKAGKVQNFASILIENNCSNEAYTDGLTTKTDKFLHGFGISNMQKAAEKYNGICTTTQKNGIFSLKILLPIFKR